MDTEEWWTAQHTGVLKASLTREQATPALRNKTNVWLVLFSSTGWMMWAVCQMSSHQYVLPGHVVKQVVLWEVQEPGFLQLDPYSGLKFSCASLVWTNVQLLFILEYKLPLETDSLNVSQQKQQYLSQASWSDTDYFFPWLSPTRSQYITLTRNIHDTFINSFVGSEAKTVLTTRGEICSRPRSVPLLGPDYLVMWAVNRSDSSGLPWFISNMFHI